MRSLFRGILAGAALAGAAALAGGAMAQEAPKSIKVGYAIALSGPEAPGAGLTTLPNYRLWIKEVNDAGGLMLKKYGKKVPIEAVELDDTSSPEARQRLIEKLMAVDKVDLVLTPWSTGANLATAPTFAKYGYPQIMGTAGSDKMEELVVKFPTMFFFLAKNADQTKALVDMMAAAKKDGKINDQVALFIVQAPFGQEYIASLKPNLAAAGFKIAYEAVYDAKASDLSTQIKAAKAAGPDTMIALSYPPDTFMITEQSLANDFKPKIRFLGVGAAFPPYKGKFGDKIEGNFSLGGWDPNGPGMQDYFKRHTAFTGGKEPDRWASPATYAGLQALQQAIERVGEIDRAKIIQALKTGTFKTVAGDLTLAGNRDAHAWLIGQWQGGEFYAVAPASRSGAKAPVIK
ncbi:MAG TPA: amino acid ABC transporter substrate-binding protein [Hyphomicrobiaceae bacterium]|jgi:branched-chain amino acid transport system substrate-binding protein|nr:amino acid ABC transporter substrate-binding protein [Hyphomicrobiaceae bacterium]